MCIATVHHHKVVQRADRTWGEHDPDCKDVGLQLKLFDLMEKQFQV